MSLLCVWVFVLIMTNLNVLLDVSVSASQLQLHSVVGQFFFPVVSCWLPRGFNAFFLVCVCGCWSKPKALFLKDGKTLLL